MQCPRATVTVAAGAPTSLGTSARELADALRGPWVAPLKWYRSERRSEITVEVGFTAEQARLLQASPDGGVSTCGDELELDVTVELTTEDGLLAESVPAIARALSASDVVVEVDMDPAALHGTYDAASELDLSNWSEPRLIARLRFMNGELAGELTLDGGDPNPSDSETPVSAAVAGWPSP